MQEDNSVLLGSLIRERAPFPPAVTLALARRLCAALNDAESQGIGRAAFGGRTALTPDSFSVTPAGRIELRPNRLGADDRPGFRTWAAPEQLDSGGSSDIRAWLFSLGAILFEAATGEVLFESDSPPAAAALVTEDLDSHLMLVDVQDRLSSIHPALAEVLFSCLASDPEGRPESVPAVHDALPAPPAGADLALDSILADARAPQLPDPFATPSHPGFIDAHGGFTDPRDSKTDLSLGGQSHEIRLDRYVPPPPEAIEPAKAPAPAPRPRPALSLVVPEDEEPAPPPRAAPAPPPLEPPPPSTFSLASEERAPAPEDSDDPWGPAREVTSGTLRSTMAPPPMQDARVRPIREIPPGLLTAARRLLLFAAFLLLLAAGAALAAWVGALPSLPAPMEARLDASVETLPAPLAQVVARRSDPTRGPQVWRGFVSRLPESLQRELLPPRDPRTAEDWAGVPGGEGIVDAVFGRLEPEPGLSGPNGQLALSLSHAGSAMTLGGSLRWIATPAPDPRLPDLQLELDALDKERAAAGLPALSAPNRESVSGQGTAPVPLAPGFWDIELRYDESPLAGGWTGLLHEVRVSPGHASRYSASLAVPAGTLRPRILVDGEDGSDHARIAVYEANAGAKARAAERAAAQDARARGESFYPDPAPPTPEGAAPLWEGPVAELPALPSGSVLVRASWDDGAHHPSASWSPPIAVPERMAAAELTLKMEREEALNPTGPGVRIRATNRGEDVSRFTEIYVYEPGTNIDHGAARFRGRAGRYFDVDPGTWDLRFVYSPPGASLGVYGENVLNHFVVKEAGVTEGKLDIGFEASQLELKVREGDEDLSSELELRVMHAGADLEAASPVVVEVGLGTHVLPSGSYDIYLSRRGRLLASFKDIELKPGDRWVQAFDLTQRPLTAAPPIPAG